MGGEGESKLGLFRVSVLYFALSELVAYNQIGCLQPFFSPSAPFSANSFLPFSAFKFVSDPEQNLPFPSREWQQLNFTS